MKLEIVSNQVNYLTKTFILAACILLLSHSAKSQITVSFVNSETEEVLFELTDEMEINIDEINLTAFGIVVSSTPENTQSVTLSLSGMINKTKTENIAPYSLFGDEGEANIFGRTAQVGAYTISAEAFSAPGASGNSLAATTIQFTIKKNRLRLDLVNADLGNTLFELTDGLRFNPWVDNPFSLFFSIVAGEVPLGTESVIFEMTGPINQTRTENIAPYSLFGDQFNGTQFNGAVSQEGTYQIRARAFAMRDASGTLLDEVNITFSFLRDISIVLIDADTEQDVFAFTGQDINLDDVPNLNNFSFKLTAFPEETRSAQFSINGPISSLRVENQRPYSAFGDSNGGTLFAGQPAIVGTYLMVISTFDQRDGEGTQLSSDTYIFSFETDANPAAVVNPLEGTGDEILVILPKRDTPEEFMYTVQFENQIKQGQVRIPASTGQIILPIQDLNIPKGSTFTLKYEFNHRRETVRLLK